MKKDAEILLLKGIIEDTFWMARRYAHGRHTASPTTIRNCYKLLKKHFPELVPHHDMTLSKPDKISPPQHKDDYLNDINPKGDVPCGKNFGVKCI